MVACPEINGVVVVLAAEEMASEWGALASGWPGVTEVVPGGETRAESVAAGLRAAANADYVLIHDAARPLVSRALVDRIIEGVRVHGAVVPGVSVPDTVKRVAEGIVCETVNRSDLRLAQTPQAARRDWLLSAIEKLGENLRGQTDEAGILEQAGYAVHCVEGERCNRKITTRDDLDQARRWYAESSDGATMDLRVGTGFDIHRRCAATATRPLVLGGIAFPDEDALEGHSDADVVFHAAMDALLGAVSLGDIGQHFPPGDKRFKDADSAGLAVEVRRLVKEAGFEPVNLDITFLGQSPRIGPHADAMRARIGEAFGMPADRIGLKATTLEGLGALGRGEGLACQAVALVRRRDG